MFTDNHNILSNTTAIRSPFYLACPILSSASKLLS